MLWIYRRRQWNAANGDLQGVFQLGELLLQTGQRRQNGFVAAAFAVEFAFFFCGGNDLVDCRAYVIDRGLIGFRCVFGGWLDHGLNAGSDDQQLGQQGFQSRCGSFIHWGFALGWGLRSGFGRRVFDAETLEHAGEHGGETTDLALRFGFTERAKLVGCGVIRIAAGTAGKVEFLGADTGGFVSNRDAGHIGFASASEIRLDLDAGEELFAGVIEAQQLVVGFQLRFKGDLPRLQVVRVLNETHGEHGAE